MDYNKNIEKIINDGKWVKNDIGMGRVQCSKLVNTGSEPELMIFLVSNTLSSPVSAYIEKILVENEQIILFYDGQYASVLNKEQYDEYNKYLSEEEWNYMFSDDPVDKLVNNEYISNNQGYYLQIHETVEKFILNGYDVMASEALEKEYNLIK